MYSGLNANSCPLVSADGQFIALLRNNTKPFSSCSVSILNLLLVFAMWQRRIRSAHLFSTRCHFVTFLSLICRLLAQEMKRTESSVVLAKRKNNRTFSRFRNSRVNSHRNNNQCTKLGLGAQHGGEQIRGRCCPYPRRSAST